MSNNRYTVRAGTDTGTVQMSEQGDKAGVAFGSEKAQCEGARAGSTLWAVMRKGGLSAQNQNLFVVTEEGEGGQTIAVIPAVLEGAHAVWTVFDRADKGSSAFFAAGSRKRIGDALDLAFETLSGELFLPHKP